MPTHAAMRETYRALRALGWTEEQVESAVRARVDESLARSWVERAGLTFEEVMAWWRVALAADDGTAPVGPGWDLEVHQWAQAGVSRPEERPEGVTPGAALMCSVARVPVDPGWGARLGPGRRARPQEGLGMFLCPALVLAAAGHRQAPAVAAALLDALMPGEGPLLRHGRRACEHPMPPTRTPYSVVGCGWDRDITSAVSAYLSSLEGLDWADVTVCLRAGMPRGAAREHVRSGADLGPLRLLVALT